MMLRDKKGAVRRAERNARKSILKVRVFCVKVTHSLRFSSFIVHKWHIKSEPTLLCILKQGYKPNINMYFY